MIWFTHGHWSERIWQIISGDPLDPFLDQRNGSFLRNWPKIKAYSLTFAYDHPSIIRQLYLLAEHIGNDVRYHFPRLFSQSGGGLGMEPAKEYSTNPFVFIRRTEDLYYSIVSDVRNNLLTTQVKNDEEIDLDDFRRALRNHSSKVADLIKGQVDLGSLLGVARGKKLMDKWREENNPDREMNGFNQRLARIALQGFHNYSFHDGGISEREIGSIFTGSIPFLIHGHFHFPRKGAMVIDDGCMLTVTSQPKFEITTYVIIEEDGSVYGP